MKPTHLIYAISLAGLVWLGISDIISSLTFAAGWLIGAIYLAEKYNINWSVFKDD